MTIIELLPWLLAICIALLTGAILSRDGHSWPGGSIIAILAGVAAFAAYWLVLKSLVFWTRCRRAQNEKQERERRRYHSFDSTNAVGRELFYECSVCGNVVPIRPKKDVACKCRNIAVDPKSLRVEIRDQTKVKLFSYAPA